LQFPTGLFSYCLHIGYDDDAVTKQVKLSKMLLQPELQAVPDFTEWLFECGTQRRSAVIEGLGENSAAQWQRPSDTIRPTDEPLRAEKRRTEIARRTPSTDGSLPSRGAKQHGGAH
jgi:hypothetical protein